MNRGMPRQLKPYDLTLCQVDYDEDEPIEVPDRVWQIYKHHKRTRKAAKPRSRKELMMCVYFLAKDLFGDRFVRRSETSKRGKRCFNFITDEEAVEVAIGLTNWGRQDLDDFQHEIVETHGLGQQSR